MESLTDRGVEPRPLREAVAARKWSVLALVVLLTGAAIFLSYQQTPIYSSEARVLVRLNEPVITADGENINLETERELAESPAVAELAAANLPSRTRPDDPSAILDDLTVELLEDTEILEFAYLEADPEVAQDRANAFAAAFIEFRRQRLREATETSLEGIEREIQILNRRLRLVNDRIAQTSNTTRLARLQGQESTLLNVLLERELQRVELTNIPSVGAIIKPAQLPVRPSQPNHVVDGVLGLVLGLMIGTGYAAFRARREQQTLSPSELESTFGAPVMGMIPRFGGRRREIPLVQKAGSDPWMEEAYRILRTNVLSAATSQNLRTILITSANPGDGKSLTAANLALVTAASSRRVVLVSGDLRNYKLNEMFGRDRGPGLTDVVRGTHSLDQVMTSVRPGLDFLTGGGQPDDPASLLGSRGMEELLVGLEARADVVIVDTAPLLGMADTVALAPLVDGVVVVVDGRSRVHGHLIRERKQLDRVGAHLVGLVLNYYDGELAEGYSTYPASPSTRSIEPLPEGRGRTDAERSQPSIP